MGGVGVSVGAHAGSPRWNSEVATVEENAVRKKGARSSGTWVGLADHLPRSMFIACVMVPRLVAGQVSATTRPPGEEDAPEFAVCIMIATCRPATSPRRFAHRVGAGVATDVDHPAHRDGRRVRLQIGYGRRPASFTNTANCLNEQVEPKGVEPSTS
jgi:hypothetical protein